MTSPESPAVNERTDRPSAGDTDPVIMANDLSFTYRDGTQALSELSLTIREGEFLGVVGETGAGKTTLLSAMCGIIPFNTSGDREGTVQIRGTPVSSYDSIGELSSTVSMVLDSPENQLFNLHVRDEIMWGPENAGVAVEEVRRRTEEAISLFGLDGYEQRVTYTLSGGEKQKVAIASIYALDPDIILLDEPTSQLDPIGTEMVFDAIDSLLDQGVTIVMVEHKIEELAAYADRIAHLEDGHLRTVKQTEAFFVEDRGTVTPPQVTDLGIQLRKNHSEHEVPLRLSAATDTYAAALGDLSADDNSESTSTNSQSDK